jgi:hypothetical protein
MHSNLGAPEVSPLKLSIPFGECEEALVRQTVGEAERRALRKKNGNVFAATGSLQSEGGEAKPVKYSFVIQQTTVTRPDRPPASGPAGSRGTVSSLDGSYFSEGLYLLTLNDGQRVRVQNLGGEWRVLGG